MDWKVPLADVVVSDDDLAQITATYRSGWLSMGPRTSAFESAFAAYTNAPYAFAVTNGTAALHLACLAAGFGAGDEVIVPSITFVATANAVAYTGARPVFADIDGPATPWLTPETIERARTARTRGVVYVTYGGHPGASTAVAEYCESANLALVEDAAHAVGTRTATRHAGTLGAAGAFSFFSNKNLAVGEGGMVTCRDEQAANQITLMRSHGMTTLSWDRHHGHATTYDVIAHGYNYRIDEARAALGTSRLARIDSENAARRRIDADYRAALGSDERLTLALAPTTDACTRACHLFTIMLRNDVDRVAFRQQLASRGVQTSIHYPPAHRFSIYEDSTYNLPVTDAYAEHTVTLPLFGHMEDWQVELVVSGVVTALTEARV
jgi:dTDP-4-amino-4,6-dideoxygalactose transaminase